MALQLGLTPALGVPSGSLCAAYASSLHEPAAVEKLADLVFEVLNLEVAAPMHVALPGSPAAQERGRVAEPFASASKLVDAATSSSPSKGAQVAQLRHPRRSRVPIGRNEEELLARSTWAIPPELLLVDRRNLAHLLLVVSLTDDIMSGHVVSTTSLRVSEPCTKRRPLAAGTGAAWREACPSIALTQKLRGGVANFDEAWSR